MGMLRWGETSGFLEIEGGEEISGFDSKDRIGPGREVKYFGPTTHRALRVLSVISWHQQYRNTLSALIPGS